MPETPQAIVVDLFMCPIQHGIEGNESVYTGSSTRFRSTRALCRNPAYCINADYKYLDRALVDYLMSSYGLDLTS